MKCKLTTITPCHIGCGNTLYKDLDFVVDGIGDDKRVGVLSPDKIYHLLGERGIDQWCQAIERKESIWKVVKTQKPNAQLTDICSRVWGLNGGSECAELKEHITSNGTFYIPGSSIKGAIVSAIVGECRSKIKLPISIRNKNNQVAEQVLVLPTTNRKGETSHDPKNSNLRFLHVGDAYFDNADIAVAECYSLNLREKGSLIDRKVRALVECINYGEEALVDIEMKTELQKIAQSAVPPLPEMLRSEESLLNAINGHTKRLLKAELNFWSQQQDRDYYHIDSDEEQEELEYYQSNIRDALVECNCCQPGHEAILRVGYGSGWRFMTGHWIEEESEKFSEITAKVWGEKRSGIYRQYDFPKTRRVALGTPMGFVKLTKIG